MWFAVFLKEKRDLWLFYLLAIFHGAFPSFLAGVSHRDAGIGLLGTVWQKQAGNQAQTTTTTKNKPPPPIRFTPNPFALTPSVQSIAKRNTHVLPWARSFAGYLCRSWPCRGPGWRFGCFRWRPAHRRQCRSSCPSFRELAWRRCRSWACGRSRWGTWYREKAVFLCYQGAVENSWDILNVFFFFFVVTNIIKINQTGSDLANEAKICNQNEFGYSL